MKIRNRYKLFKLLVDFMFGCLVVNEKGRIIFANRRIADMLKYRVNEISGKNMIDFIDPKYKDMVRRKIATGYEKPYKVIVRRKDGSKFVAMIREREFKYNNKTLRFVVIDDITEYMLTQERVKKNLRSFL